MNYRSNTTRSKLNRSVAMLALSVVAFGCVPDAPTNPDFVSGNAGTTSAEVRQSDRGVVEARSMISGITDYYQSFTVAGSSPVAGENSIELSASKPMAGSVPPDFNVDAHYPAGMMPYGISLSMGSSTGGGKLCHVGPSTPANVYQNPGASVEWRNNILRVILSGARVSTYAVEGEIFVHDCETAIFNAQGNLIGTEVMDWHLKYSNND